MKQHRLAVLITALALAATAGWGQYLETTIDLGATGAMELIWNPISNKVYTANYDNTVSIIDGATNTVLRTLTLPDFPIHPTLNPNTNKVYFACVEDRRLVAVDGWTNEITANVRVTGNPGGVAFSVTSNKLYIGDDAGRVTIVDGSADTVIRWIRLQDNGNLLMMWHPQTNRLLCSSAYDTIIALDCATDAVVSKIPTGSSAGGYVWDWCYNPVNHLAYVGGGYGVLAISAGGDSIVARIAGYNNGLCSVPYPDKLYLDLWHMEGRIGVLDCGSHTVIDSVPMCAGPMVCDSVRGKVYVSYVNNASESLGVIDARADTVIASFYCPAGASPRNEVCWNATDARAYYATQTTLICVVRDTTTAIAEPREAERCSRRASCTVVGRSGAWTVESSGEVIDAGGRIVAEVSPGLNDFRRLAPGAYIVVDRQGRAVARFVKVR